jgi:hypothetical protein
MVRDTRSYLQSRQKQPGVVKRYFEEKSVRYLGLEILASTGETLARHQLSREKGKNVVDLKHYQGLRENSGTRKHQLSCLFQRRFPEAGAGRFLAKRRAAWFRSLHS